MASLEEQIALATGDLNKAMDTLDMRYRAWREADARVTSLASELGTLRLRYREERAKEASHADR